MGRRVWRWAVRGLLALALVMAGVVLVFAWTVERPVVGSGPARFVTGSCVVTLPGEVLRCGTLDVPEDRAKARGNRVLLPIVILTALPGAPQPPLVYASGGPGASALADVVFLARLAEVRAGREVIVVEQRGAGYANPRLLCEASLGGLVACRVRLALAGVDRT